VTVPAPVLTLMEARPGSEALLGVPVLTPMEALLAEAA